MVFKRNGWLLLTLVLSFTTSAWAVEKPLWEVGIGAALGSYPIYRGASTQYTDVLPFPFLVYRGEIVSLDREGLQAKLFESDRWRLELSADAMVPVDEDEGLREGMPELAPIVELGPSLEYLLYESSKVEWRLRFPLRSAIALDFPDVETRGGVFHPNLAVELHNGSWEIGGSTGPLFASRSFHDYYYGVSDEYATSEREAYRAEGGYSGFRLNMGASRYFGDIWIGMFLRYDDLHGVTFRDSPLMEQDYAIMGGIAITWLFLRSDTMVDWDR